MLVSSIVTTWMASWANPGLGSFYKHIMLDKAGTLYRAACSKAFIAGRSAVVPNPPRRISEAASHRLL
jgi:hypothetical protein